MIGWTHERSGERDGDANIGDLAQLIQALINAAFAAVTIIAGVLVVCAALFTDAGGDAVRWSAGALGVGAIVAGGLMGRRE